MKTLRSLDRHLRDAAVVLALGALTFSAAAQSGDDTKKAARRAQLQMQQLQQQAQEAQAAKAKVESDKAALDKTVVEQSQQMARLRGALPKVQERLKAAEAERSELVAKVAALEKQLAEQKAGAEAAQTSAERNVKLRDEQQAQLQRRHDAQQAQVGECSAKNERLVKISAELLNRYRNKSVADVLSQRDPVLGLGDVQMFNLVQEYRDKADAERYAPPINR